MKQLAVQMMGRAVVAQIQTDHVVTEIEELLRQRQHVQRIGAALPAVQHDRRVPHPSVRSRDETLQPHPVAAVEQDRLAGGDHGRSPAGDRAAPH